MSFFRNMKIRNKLFLVFALINIVFLSGFALVFTSLQTINKATSDIYNQGLIGIENLIEADRDGYQSSIAISQSLINLASIDNAALEQNLSDIDTNLAQVQERFPFSERYSLPPIQKMFQPLESLMKITRR